MPSSFNSSLGTCLSILLLSVLWVGHANASPVDTFEFKDEATELRFQTLSKELRCPKCQNQKFSRFKLEDRGGFKKEPL